MENEINEYKDKQKQTREKVLAIFDFLYNSGFNSGRKKQTNLTKHKGRMSTYDSEQKLIIRFFIYINSAYQLAIN